MCEVLTESCQAQNGDFRMQNMWERIDHVVISRNLSKEIRDRDIDNRQTDRYIAFKIFTILRIEWVIKFGWTLRSMIEDQDWIRIWLCLAGFVTMVLNPMFNWKIDNDIYLDFYFSTKWNPTQEEIDQSALVHMCKSSALHVL